MSGYLLLRNNKELGPFTLEQIIDLGLKKYDLVWVNGKSAAWRYPGELEELKAYAPLVEEQPYDRFYKKNSNNASSTTATTHNNNSQENTWQLPLENVASKNEFIKVKDRVSVIAPQSHKATKNIQVLPATTNKASFAKTINDSNKQRVEAPLVLEEKYSMPLDEIKQLYIQNVLNKGKKNSKRVAFALPAVNIKNVANIKLFAGVVGFFVVAITLGYLLTGKNDTAYIAENKTVEQFGTDGNTIQSKDMSDEIVSNKKHRSITTAKNSLQTKNLTAAAVATTRQQQIEENYIQQPENAKNTITFENNIPQNEKTSKSFIRNSLPVTEKKALHQPEEESNSIQSINFTEDDAKTNTTHQNNITHTAILNNTTVTEKNTANTSVSETEKQWTKKRIKKLLVVEDVKYKTNILGGVRDVSVHLTNHSKFTIDMVVVELDYMKGNDNTLKTEKIYFKNVSPDAAVHLPAPNYNRGSKLDYRITLINCSQLDFYYATAY